MNHIIIGAGIAGIKAAESIRKHQPDASITVISSDDKIHSRCMLHHYLSGERTVEGLSFIDPDFFDKHHVQWINNKKVDRILPDAQLIRLADGEKLHYDKLLIATGAKSFIPPIGALPMASNVYGLRDLSDAQAIEQDLAKAQKVLVIGSGLVGLDAAYALLERGLKVTIVELADHILPMQLDHDSASKYQRLFEDKGAHFILGQKAIDTRVEGDRVKAVVLDDNRELEADLIIVAAGVRANLDALQDSGIEMERGIQVDEFMQTNISNIYAAGDVTALSGIWPNAALQGEIAGANMCGEKRVYDDRYCMKNTINFDGLTTLSLGNYLPQEGDQVYERQGHNYYQRLVINDDKLRSVILQGNINYSGFWQYLVKNQIDISAYRDNPFKISFAHFYDIKQDGHYQVKSS